MRTLNFRRAPHFGERAEERGLSLAGQTVAEETARNLVGQTVYTRRTYNEVSRVFRVVDPETNNVFYVPFRYQNGTVVLVTVITQAQVDEATRYQNGRVVYGLVNQNPFVAL